MSQHLLGFLGSASADVWSSRGHTSMTEMSAPRGVHLCAVDTLMCTRGFRSEQSVIGMYRRDLYLGVVLKQQKRETHCLTPGRHTMEGLFM
jgi:hypothetical protein